MSKKAPISSKILDISLSSTSLGQVIKSINLSLKSKKRFLIVTPNPEIVLQAQTNSKLKTALNSADFALPDGIGLVFAAKLLGQPKLNRLRGREVMLELFAYANKQRKKIFLLGATPQVNALALKRLAQQYPKLQAHGSSGPDLDQFAKPITADDAQKNNAVLGQINKLKPDILFVAFGAPKQELWLAQNWKKLKIGGAMTVGGSLDYYTGTTKLPPSWLAKLGFEWLWRLITQPKRIKRIFKATIIFPCQVFISRLKQV